MTRNALPLRRSWPVAGCVLHFFVVFGDSWNFVVLFLFDLVLMVAFDVFSTGYYGASVNFNFSMVLTNFFKMDSDENNKFSIHLSETVRIVVRVHLLYLHAIFSQAGLFPKFLQWLEISRHIWSLFEVIGVTKLSEFLWQWTFYFIDWFFRPPSLFNVNFEVTNEN